VEDWYEYWKMIVRDLSEQMEVRRTGEESTRDILFYPENGDSRFLIIVGKHLLDCTVSQPSRLYVYIQRHMDLTYHFSDKH
jgi:hypothetical protein